MNSATLKGRGGCGGGDGSGGGGGAGGGGDVGGDGIDCRCVAGCPPLVAEFLLVFAVSVWFCFSVYLVLLRAAVAFRTENL